jgi:hypothetical protein
MRLDFDPNLWKHLCALPASILDISPCRSWVPGLETTIRKLQNVVSCVAYVRRNSSSCLKLPLLQTAATSLWKGRTGTALNVEVEYLPFFFRIQELSTSNLGWK